MQALRHYLLAVQFFTRIPVTGRLAQWVGYSPAMLRASSAHFPGVGWLVAGVAAGTFAALHEALGPGPVTPFVAAVFCTIATVRVTGGFHEDGLADVADGLGGSPDRERALDIMKDSRIGAFGAMALVLALLAKIGLLALLGAHSLGAALAALVGAHVVSRFWPLLLIRTLVHVGDTARSKSKPLADQITGAALGAAVLWCFMPLAIVWQAQSALFLIASLLISALIAAWMARWFARRLQGFTGDCLGATQQVSEIGFYLGAALSLGPLARWAGA
ncbi:MAG TPA: adenosylcobinamide-GDP ribazoletransferase [Comamonadaceae bacterium]|nr:MAG: adenosylcobinamide-GDP ribazoletransferase [Burkholderiales bacterium RIFCSPHIGHO2_12_63_9]OGB46684.1 MAG: adenosylcobinamide-GDP ribazoletransferase [Burkholderiales bacterium RIFCSPLOWO2_12_FULL_65_40]HCE27989.1 adenosylcobinamide-GDP ribazoletransferase [Comamonadaceae bacterium]